MTFLSDSLSFPLTPPPVIFSVGNLSWTGFIYHGRCFRRNSCRNCSDEPRQLHTPCTRLTRPVTRNDICYNSISFNRGREYSWVPFIFVGHIHSQVQLICLCMPRVLMLVEVLFSFGESTFIVVGVAPSIWRHFLHKSFLPSILTPPMCRSQGRQRRSL